MKILSIVVTYNATTNNWIYKCLRSLESSSMKNDILIIDNASTDDTTRIIEQEFKQVQLIKSSVNLGFARANNIGFEKAINENYDYIFLLNQDAWIERDSLKTLIDFTANNPEYGIISPVHLNGSGSNLDMPFHEYIARHKNKLIFDALRAHSVKEFYEVDFINAACWLVSGKCLKTIGNFDDALFSHYGEDSNYVNRVKYYGFKLAVLTSCFVYHDREDRGMEKQESAFVNKSTDRLLSFIIVGSDINDINYIEEMNKSIFLDCRAILRNLLSLRFKSVLFFLKLVRKKMKFKKIIQIQRQKYIHNYEIEKLKK